MQTPSLKTPQNRPAETASGVSGTVLMLLIWRGMDPVLAGGLVGVLGYLPGAITWMLVTWRTAGKA